jgi:hypothetical protein
MKPDDNQKNGQQDSIEIFSSMMQLSISLNPITSPEMLP